MNSRFRAAVYTCLLSGLTIAFSAHAVDIINPGFENGWEGWTDGDPSGSGTAISGKSDRFSEVELANGATDARYFYTAEDGGMVFRATIGGARTSKNTNYTRTELREMLRRGNTKIGTQGEGDNPGANNWVFSSAPIGSAKKGRGRRWHLTGHTGDQPRYDHRRGLGGRPGGHRANTRGQG